MSHDISFLSDFPQYNELMVPDGEGCGEGMVREFGMDVCTLLYCNWIANKDVVGSTWNAAQCHVTAWVGGKLICMAECLCCPPESLTTLIICYPNTKLKV